MTVVRANALALVALRTRVRDLIRDSDSDYEGNAIPEGSRRFSDAMVLRALNDALKEIQVKTTGDHPGESIVRTGSLALDSDGKADLSSVIGGGTVYAVYLESSPGDTQGVIEYAPPTEIERYKNSGTGRSPRYTLLSGNLGGVVIKVRPITTTRIAIDTVAPPLVMADDTDVSPLRPEWEELLVLLAGQKLQSPDNEFSEQSFLLLEQRRRDFLLFASRRRGTQRLQRTRRFRAAR